MVKFRIIALASNYVSYTAVNHSILETIIRPGDTVIDATCGKGFDSLFLAKSALTQDSGKLICIDIQNEAIEITRKRLQEHGYHSNIEYICGSHETFPSSIPIRSTACIMYNLGYLPGSGKKDIITMASSTVKSLRQASTLIRPGGIINVMAYRGHSGGPEEAESVIKFMESELTDEWDLNVRSKVDSPISPLIVTAEYLKPTLT